VLGIDFCEPMLRRAKGLADNIHPVLATAERLPFADSSLDGATVAFGLRNVTDKDAALREMLRVLKVGGQARVLGVS
ncbi:methyltransferase domain-containing protein, partial [Citrobacter sp. AAK_AS5]